MEREVAVLSCPILAPGAWRRARALPPPAPRGVARAWCSSGGSGVNEGTVASEEASEDKCGEPGAASHLTVASEAASENEGGEVLEASRVSRRSPVASRQGMGYDLGLPSFVPQP